MRNAISFTCAPLSERLKHTLQEIVFLRLALLENLQIFLYNIYIIEVIIQSISTYFTGQQTKHLAHSPSTTGNWPCETM